MGKTEMEKCDKGIYQRRDGLYSARFYVKDGKRKEKHFNARWKRKTGLLTQGTKNNITGSSLSPIWQLTSGLLAAAFESREYHNNHGRKCFCDRQIYDKSRPPI